MTVPVVRFVVAGNRDQSYVPCDTCDYTVVYDGHCKVCGRLVRLLRWWDRRHRLEIVPSQAPGVQARFPWIPARAYQEALQVVARDGETWQGAAAIELLLRVLPKGRLLSWIFSVPFMRVLADRFYKWFASHRYKLGCGAHCAYRPLDIEFESGSGSEARSR